MPLADAFVRSGKVRDLYRVDDDRLLLVASDRLSAFDVVLPTPIPDKGRILTGLSRFWFSETTDLVANHLLSTDPADLPAERDRERPRADRGPARPDDAGPPCRRPPGGMRRPRVRVRLGLEGLPGHGRRVRYPVPRGSPRERPPALARSSLPPGRRPPASTTRTSPSTGPGSSCGEGLAEQVRSISLALYHRGAALCERVGIILADTKFEFGVLPSGELLLIDEVMTPDSSRFWDAEAYEPGRAQASYDKQFVRDWLEQQPWDKTAPGPELPDDVVAGTRARYVEAFERITGASFARYLTEDVIAR